MTKDQVMNSEELLKRAGLINDLPKIVGMKVEVISKKGFHEKKETSTYVNRFVTTITGINIHNSSEYGQSIYLGLASGFYPRIQHIWLEFEFEDGRWTWILKTEASWYHVSEIRFMV